MNESGRRHRWPAWMIDGVRGPGGNPSRAPVIEIAVVCGTTSRKMPSPNRTRESRIRRVELPVAGDAFELVDSSLRKVEPGSGDEIDDRAGHQHLTRPRESGHSSADMEGDTTQVVTVPFTLPGMH